MKTSNAQSRSLHRWTEEKPKRRGWWWVELVNNADGDRAASVRVVKALRAYGNRFCVLLPTEGWVPVDDFTEGEARWAGPLDEPLEASDAATLPNEKVSDGGPTTTGFK